MNPPVVYLAFANDKQQSHLELLDRERKNISQKLIPLQSDQYIQLISESAATIDDLIHYFTIFNNNIIIFHYGGHAGNKEIFLQDASANAQGLAKLLATQSELKLVFLNGCSTKGQVEHLLKLGIKAIIATNVAIGDGTATDFATHFYSALSEMQSIEEAFNTAAAGYQMKKNKAAVITRSLDIFDEIEEVADEMPWALHIHPDHQNALQWKLPSISAGTFLIPNAGKKYGNNMANEQLIQTIANSIKPYSDDIQFLIERAQKQNKPPKLRDLRATIIDAFPIPIGTHLRKLFLSEKPEVSRLHQIANVYNISINFLSFCLLAQLWDTIIREASYNIPKDQKTVISDYLALEPEQAAEYDMIILVRAILSIFEANETEPFIKEVGQLRKEFNDNSTFFAACSGLHELDTLLKGTIAAEEIESFCVQAEAYLEELFRHIGFAVNYTLMTIKSIELSKKRFKKPEYIHNLIVLDKLTAAFGELDERLTFTQFSENQSVLLLKNENTIYPYLNLSPFLIDENALTNQMNSKLYFYEGNMNGTYRYIFSGNLKEHLLIQEDNHKEVKVLFDQYIRDISNHNQG